MTNAVTLEYNQLVDHYIINRLIFLLGTECGLVYRCLLHGLGSFSHYKRHLYISRTTIWRLFGDQHPCVVDVDEKIEHDLLRVSKYANCRIQWRGVDPVSWRVKCVRSDDDWQLLSILRFFFRCWRRCRYTVVESRPNSTCAKIQRVFRYPKYWLQMAHRFHCGWIRWYCSFSF